MSAAFRDPAVEPVTTSIHAVLGTAGEAWDRLAELMGTLGVTVGWRYYRDGGWLAKAARNSRTVAWLNVVPGCVRVTVYFAERHRPMLVDNAELPPELRDRIATVALIGTLLPVSLEVRDTAAVADVGAVLGIKLAV
ncbi:MAG TPA: DUF3788 family protein [Propionicimonas sp.]|uniref:DUF3788 family protein n=1 Tax=Propionicimonas sp. TaxID=1955623 RepID=UPI002F4059E5